MTSFDKTINKEPTTPKSLQDKLIEVLDVELRHNKEYWIPLLLSTIIATLGLLTNNSAVVIGAMIMAPLFWPLLGVTMGTITTRRHLLQKSIVFITLSILLVVAVSWLVTIVTPIEQITEEIRLRTNPTLLDLFIALASSVIAILAVSFPQISNSIAGVAVSIALLPPLCVIGIGIAFQSLQIFQGSVLLFGANMSAILFSGIVTLYSLGLKPKRRDETRWRVGVSLSTVLLILISVPLTIYFIEAITQAKTRTQINKVLERQILELYETARIDSLDVNFGFRSNQVDIEATIYLPEGNYLTITNKNEISEALGQLVEKTVNLQLVVVNTLTLRRQEDTAWRNMRNQINNWLTNQLAEIDSEIVIQNIEISQDQEDENQKGKLQVLLTARNYSGVPFTFDQKREMQLNLSEFINQEVQLEIDFIAINRIKSQGEISKLTTQAKQVIAQDLSGINSNARASEVQLEERNTEDGQPMGMIVNAVIWLPENTNLTEIQRLQIENDLAIQLQRPIQLNITVFKFLNLKSAEDNYSKPTEVFGKSIIEEMTLYP